MTAVSLHPGVVKTDIWRNRGEESSFFDKFLMSIIRPLVGIFGIRSDEGAKTTIHCATSDEIPSHNGKYFAYDLNFYFFLLFSLTLICILFLFVKSKQG